MIICLLLLITILSLNKVVLSISISVRRVCAKDIVARWDMSQLALCREWVQR